MPSIELVRELRGHQGSVNVVRYSSDGDYCLSGGEDRSLRLWNPAKEDPAGKGGGGGGLQIKAYEGAHGYGVLDVCITSDNARFASAGGDRAAFLWDVATGRVVRKLQAHTHRINALAMNADGSVLVTGSYDKSVCAWDLRASGRDPVLALADAGDSVSSVLCTPSCIVAGAVDGVLRTYDLRAGRLLEDDLALPLTHVRSVAEHRCLLSACLGGDVKLTDAGSGALLMRYSGHAHALYKTEAGVAAAGGWVVAGADDGWLHAWEYTTGRPLLRTQAHTRCIAALDTHPSAPQLLTASADGTIKLWQCST